MKKSHKSRNKKQVVFTIDPKLLEQIDTYCKINFLNRSEFIKLASIAFLKN